MTAEDGAGADKLGIEPTGCSTDLTELSTWSGGRDGGQSAAGEVIESWSPSNKYWRLTAESNGVEALREMAVAGLDLLKRSAELPDTEQGLLRFLIEYRYAVYAIVTIAAKVRGS